MSSRTSATSRPPEPACSAWRSCWPRSTQGSPYCWPGSYSASGCTGYSGPASASPRSASFWSPHESWPTAVSRINRLLLVKRPLGQRCCHLPGLLVSAGYGIEQLLVCLLDGGQDRAAQHRVLRYGSLAGRWFATNDVAGPAVMPASASGTSLRGWVRRGVVVCAGELDADLAGVGVL